MRVIHRFGSLPSIENLQCFLAACSHGHFRGAAAEVGLTATAFSQRIMQLEEHLGVRLFERTTRKMHLTEAGLALMPAARVAVSGVAECLKASRGEAPALTFTLGSRFELAATWLAPSLAALAALRPSWRIHLYCGSGPDILDRLFAGLLDAVVTSAPVSRAGYSSTVLHPETYSFVGAPALIERLPLSTADDCPRHTLLDIDRSLPLTRYLTSSPGPELAFGDERYLGAGAAMHSLALAGHGVCVLPDYMTGADLAEGRLVRLFQERPLLSDSFRLLYRTDSALSTALAALARFLSERPLT